MLLKQVWPHGGNWSSPEIEVLGGCVDVVVVGACELDGVWEVELVWTEEVEVEPEEGPVAGELQFPY